MTDIAFSMAQEQIKELRAEVERSKNDYSILKRDYDELRADNERLTAAISDAPILSKYHGHHGFEVERFIADYEAWKRALESKPWPTSQ